MGSVEAVDTEISKVNANIEALLPKIQKAEARIDEAETAGNENAAERWFTELKLLREEKNKLLDEKNKLRDEKARLESADGSIPYFIPPKAQALVKQSVFYILGDDSEEKGIGVGVFYGPHRAVTADHNLTEDHKIGCLIKAKIPETMEEVELRIIHRESDSDFAILESSLAHPHVPIFAQSPTLLMGSELVLASFRIGIEEETPLFSRRLGFTKATAIVLSEHMLHLLYACPTFAGDSGAALILRDGRLVGLHQESVNALRERLERKKVTDRLAEVEQSVDQILAGGLSQGCVALLVQKFANM